METFLLWVFLPLLLGCQALDLTLERKPSPPPFNRASCGVLLCVEEATREDNGTDADGGFVESPSKADTISSLKVFKLDKSTSSITSDGRKHILLGSVTSQQSHLTRVSNGVKVDGRLEAGKASLRLEFFKQQDCLAEFVCESRGKDTGGRELVSKSHLLQQPKERDDQNDLGGSTWTPGPLMQVLSTVQQLHTKLAVIGSALGNWEDEMRRLKDSTNHGIESLHTDLNTKVDRLEDKIQYFGKDLDTQTDRLEDKIESLQNDLNRKTVRLEDKLESLNTRVEDKIDFLTKSLKEEKPGPSNSCPSGLRDIIKSTIQTEISPIHEKISEMKDTLGRVGTNIQNTLDSSFETIKQRVENTNNPRMFNNLTLPENSVTCEDSKSLCGVVSEGFHSLQDTIEEKFREMSDKINLTALETRSLVAAQQGQVNLTTAGDELMSATTDLLKPRDCYNGMAPASDPIPSQYTVIQPGQENTLLAPVLCDTFTDGGGWIVFQRRAAGDVNFYRGWEEYKNGFGSLDGDFWLGNENLHTITSTGVFELRIDMTYKGKSAFAHYGSFSVGDEGSNYVLHVEHYDGTAGDSLKYHNGMKFSTHDRDHDTGSRNCAVEYVGAWWYKNCHNSNLNGQWGAGDNKGPRWEGLSGVNPVSYTEMKVRRLL